MAAVGEGNCSRGMPSLRNGSQKWRSKTSAESLGDAVDGDGEGLVFVENLRDGDSLSRYGGAEIDEGFVGYRQLVAVEFDQADPDGPLDVFLGDVRPGETRQASGRQR